MSEKANTKLRFFILLPPSSKYLFFYNSSEISQKLMAIICNQKKQENTQTASAGPATCTIIEQKERKRTSWKDVTVCTLDLLTKKQKQSRPDTIAFYL